MKKIFIIAIVSLINQIKGIAQAFPYSNPFDSNYSKKLCYLYIKTDQLESMAISDLYKIEFTDSLFSTIEIKQVKSQGFPDDLFFAELNLQLPKAKINLSYLFCYNSSMKRFYTLNGFFNNQYEYLFDYLALKGYKISSNFFSKKGVMLSGFDISCQIEIYKKIKSRELKILEFKDRYKYPCLKFNLQPSLK